jgi:hypothetical protein
MQALNTLPWFKDLLAEHQPPCISIYHPVARSIPLATGAQAGFEYLVEKVRQQLDRRYTGRQSGPLIQKLNQYVTNAELWEGDREALAFFVSPDYDNVIQFRRPTKPLAEVADSFHVKPLIRALQLAERYQILCVAPRRVRLFEGDPYTVREIKLSPNVPTSVDDPIARESPGTSTMNTGAGQPSAPPGAIPVDRFFRLVDQAIAQHHSRAGKLPMIVCADVQHLTEFLTNSKNEHVLKEKEQAIALNPDAAAPQRLMEEATRILRPRVEQELRQLKDTYHAAKARHLGSDELIQVAEAAAIGRVGTLLVDSDKTIPGIVHRHSGLIEPADLSNPRADDILDDLAEMVLRKDGQVFVIPPDQMPTDAGVAAVFRY